jgi:putative membrane protein
MEEKYTRRDYLAQDRTYLANERTLLSYWRTAMAFLIFGTFLIKFIPSNYTTAFALFLILFGATIFVYGIIWYFKYKEKISKR